MTEAAALLDAIQFAAHKHRNQRRKDTEASPYINHPIAVAQILAGVGGVTDIVTLVAAVLHDTIEDTETTPEELEAAFGLEVRELVAEVTDDKNLPKEVRKQLQIDHAPHVSARAKAIKLGDKICNVRDVTNSPPSNWPQERRQAYLDWTERVIAGCRGTNAMLERCYDEALRAGRALLAQ
jgi:guanosine-3',5'-bis(diphosphate) 3'-pyrophosphohydrolase